MQLTHIEQYLAMSSNSELVMKRRRYSLSIHITSLFLVLAMVIGIVLIGISYHHSQQLLTVSAQGLSSENSKKLESAFKQSAAPILTTLDFLAFSNVIDQPDKVISDPRQLATVWLTFQRNPQLVALYYCDEAGACTTFRSLSFDKAKQRFDAPAQAQLLAHYTQVDGTNRFIYLDQNLESLLDKQDNNNKFDPRVRPWFTSASQDGAIRLTEPYFFFFLQTSGVTLSRRSTDGKSVLGADFTLDSLSKQMSTMGFSDSAQLILFDNQFRPLAQHNTKFELQQDPSQIAQQLQQSTFAPILNRVSSQTLYETVNMNGTTWSVTLTPVLLNDNVRLLLAEAVPQDDLIADLLSMRDQQIFVALIMLAIAFAVVGFVAQRLASPLGNLVQLTDNITRFEFKKTRYPKSRIREVANLTQSIELMEHTLHDLLRLLRETASNQEFGVLAKTITHQSYLITRAETILLYTYANENNQFITAANHAIIPFKLDINQLSQEMPWLLSELRKGQTVHLSKTDNSMRKHKDELYNSDLYLFPLLNRDKQLVGVLNLGYERAITPDQQDKHAFLRELLSFAEIAKDNIDKMQRQKKMLNSFIELIASAIDTKSPYTGGHCQRVPELTKMITKAAENDRTYFPQFSMTNEEWEELTLAAWLHDCGKVTTPEYVIDKATKLETIYDRIHEIRMRFELLKCQAETDYWQGVAQGKNEPDLKQQLLTNQQILDEEFAFVAQCNIGSEFMSDDDLIRLERIAQREWKRTLDDQLGTSWIENQRAGESKPLPTMERLLDDKPVHQLHWVNGCRPQDLWQENFILQPGELRYNRGELYNLSIRRGTLTNEERFMINDHIVQTIMMLKRLPYPEHMKNVPDIAGSHHERMDGAGYPRGLSEEQLSIPARVMAIADVFEALTSSDRPYKKAKTLSESIAIMTTMATTGHIDPKLYLLFLEKEIYQDYADRFLHSDQHSPIDKEAQIKKVKMSLKKTF
ncbi:HD domain-containing protein [Vibrio anguillarum]|nr:HD domain-containing phosphohydrolase [Vibrio anguillarum]MBF4282252.1 HD domain-containing protein [Vibrio anguillarum]MBF4287139.1 HD domain-containing protein [Vibrio anguillarum]MBF4340876.1 HD domain-containing protein [Vibrio anguillarum]MBF4357082.1 HD domain-containing protein [Vibrio anguillarum]MBF4378031.1 HD domain-containing protein [Vibrio anguillarum]